MAATLAWAGVAFGLRGWRHEVWSGAPEVLLANVRFLAGYRRRDWFEGSLLDGALAAVAEPASFSGVEARCSTVGPAAIRPALLHHVWSGALLADLGHLLSGETILERAS